jgi:hypothetical protein
MFRRQKPRLKLPQAISAKSKIGGARANALGALAESAMGAFSQIKK